MITYADADRLMDRSLDLRAVQNLMGKYAFSIMTCKESEIWASFWSQEREDVALGSNEGWYRGPEAIQSYYEAVAALTAKQSKTIQAVFPEQLENLSDEELFGVGRMDLRPLVNPIVEIAEDGRTAKGFWNVMGLDNEITEKGPLSTWRWGYLGADFVLEGDEWKIWHLLTVDDISAPMGSDWVAPKQYPVLPAFAGLKDAELPKPTEHCALFQTYSKDRPFTPPIPAPEPYETFEETFSYADWKGGD